jgi:amidase
MYIISKEAHIYSFRSDLTPVESVDSGSEVIFETYDCYREQLKSSSKNQLFSLKGINPATGPLAIRGAEPGDMLKVTILSIELHDEGTMYLRPGAGVLKKFVVHPEVKKLRVKNGTLHFDSTHSFPIKPMIGVIGVSPKEGDISTFAPGTHGGNMDTKEITAGSVVYLPVSVPGANLAIGDLHALMGDGEVPICGVEIGGRVRVKVEVLKESGFNGPVVEDREHFYVISSALTLDEACQSASENMFAFLSSRLPQYEANDIICLMGIGGDLRISQMVNPLKTAKYRIPKTLFPVRF